MRKAWRAVAAVAAVGFAGAASAHEVKCEKKVNGKAVEAINTYPTTVTYSFRVTNVLSHSESEVASAEDASLAPYGWHWPAAEDFLLSGGESISWELPVTIDSFEKCKELAYASQAPYYPSLYPAPDGPDSVNYDNYFRVVFEGGETQCSARLVCYPEPKPPPAGVATRTLGFYKTHADATQQCLDALGGAVDLGFLTVDSVADALGLLWGSPARFPDGERRSELDQKRFLLARQTLVGLCNEELFGTPTSPPDLLEQAVEALAGTACGPLSGLNDRVDAYNNSGDSEPFPVGFEVGRADPRLARSSAADPTSDSNQTCSDE